jgi:hypothetical protein
MCPMAVSNASHCHLFPDVFWWAQPPCQIDLCQMPYVNNDEARLSAFDRLAMDGEDVRIAPQPGRKARQVAARPAREIFRGTFECFEIGPDLLTAHAPRRTCPTSIIRLGKKSKSSPDNAGSAPTILRESSFPLNAFTRRKTTGYHSAQISRRFRRQWTLPLRYLRCHQAGCRF